MSDEKWKYLCFAFLGMLFVLNVDQDILGVTGMLFGFYYAFTGFMNANQKKKEVDRHVERVNTSHTREEVNVIEAYLKTVFVYDVRKCVVNDAVELRLNSNVYRSLDDVDVFLNGKRFGSLQDYKRRNGKEYNRLFDLLLSDASALRQKESYEDFVTKLNGYVSLVEDDEVKVAIEDTIQNLKQLEAHRSYLRKDVVSYEKVYAYYMPMLVKILDQFTSIQVAKEDEQYMHTLRNLHRSLLSINMALESMLIESTNEEFVNLSQDIQNLDALLKQDGFKENEY